MKAGEARGGACHPNNRQPCRTGSTNGDELHWLPHRGAKARADVPAHLVEHNVPPAFRAPEPGTRNTDIDTFMKQPQDHPRRLLVAVTGLSPQIVTETLYALAVRQKPPFVPTEVRLITTEEGAERAKLSLLHPESGWFHRLRADYDLPPIAFEPEHIHVLKDADGRPLGDIRSPEDNERAADTITDVVRELTRDDGSALHVSIAGGRKTMGFYLGYALSLYGRAQDRLSHVLVNAPYESHREFFYPTPRSELIHTPGPKSRPYDAQNAKVTLAEIPFVRLREGLNPELMEGTASFSTVVADAQRALPPLALELDPASCMVTAGGESFHMKPAWFATYWMLAERARLGKPGVHWSDGIEQELLDYYGQVVNPASGDYERAERAFARGLSAENFNPTKTHIKEELERRLGRRRAEPYLITAQEGIPGTRYRRVGLALPPEAIRIAGGKVAGPENIGGNRNDRRQRSS